VIWYYRSRAWGLDFEYKDDSVVISGHLVTRLVRVACRNRSCSVLTARECSRGPGTSFRFALTLVELLCGPEKRKAVSGPMVFPNGADL